MSDLAEQVQYLDDLLSHIWMVRTFLKHSDEAVDDQELAEVHRELYDVMLALGSSKEAGDHQDYVRIARKKLTRLHKATELFSQIQPEVSGHMNFRMAARSLRLAVAEFTRRLESVG